MPSPSTINSQLSTIPSLIPLHDGRPGLRRGLQAEVREPVALSAFPSPRGEGQGEGELQRSSSQPSTPQPSTSSPPILDFIASSEALDRYNEIISADGWRLDNYRRNPVFQNAHQYGDIIFTLGKALITEVRAGKLFQRVEFATEINPMAKIAYGLYKGKFLNAVSVGFIPLKWEDAPSSALAAPKSDAGGSSSSSIPRRKYLEQELLEVSAVGIPANPEALQLGLKAGAIEKADIRALLDLLRAAFWRSADFQSAVSQTSSLRTPESQKPAEKSLSPTHPLTGSPTHPFRGNPVAPNIHARVSGVRSYEAQLLQLARALRDVLKGDRR